MKKFLAVICAAILTFALYSGLAHAHGVIGQRFIPSTLAIEDPFPSDEMDLLTFNRGSKDKEGRETSFGFEFSKRLTPDFAIAIGWKYLLVDPTEGSKASGAANPEFNFKYALLRSPEHEGILSVGFSIEPGGVGPKRVAEKVTTLGPALYFGKGLGDLPDSLDYLKPLAITGVVEVGIPANRKLAGDEGRNSTTIGYGFAIMYSIPYLQSSIKDIGLGAPFDRMFPVAEFNFETNINNPDRGRTRGFFNPGLLWAEKYFQLGLEAQVPLNNRSGKDVGVRGLIHVFLDDIWPNIFTWTPFGTVGATQR